jgi:hypothetical protein
MHLTLAFPGVLGLFAALDSLGENRCRLAGPRRACWAPNHSARCELHVKHGHGCVSGQMLLRGVISGRVVDRAERRVARRATLPVRRVARPSSAAASRTAEGSWGKIPRRSARRPSRAWPPLDRAGATETYRHSQPRPSRSASRSGRSRASLADHAGLVGPWTAPVTAIAVHVSALQRDTGLVGRVHPRRADGLAVRCSPGRRRTPSPPPLRRRCSCRPLLPVPPLDDDPRDTRISSSRR